MLNQEVNNDPRDMHLDLAGVAVTPAVTGSYLQALLLTDDMITLSRDYFDPTSTSDKKAVIARIMQIKAERDKLLH